MRFRFFALGKFAQAEEAAKKCDLRSSGVKTPEEKSALLSCLKARPTKLATFLSFRGGLQIDDAVLACACFDVPVEVVKKFPALGR